MNEGKSVIIGGRCDGKISDHFLQTSLFLACMGPFAVTILLPIPLSQ